MYTVYQIIPVKSIPLAMFGDKEKPLMRGGMRGGGMVTIWTVLQCVGKGNGQGMVAPAQSWLVCAIAVVTTRPPMIVRLGPAAIKPSIKRDIRRDIEVALAGVWARVSQSTFHSRGI